MRNLIFVLLLTAFASAQTPDHAKLSELARREPNSAAFRDALAASFKAEDIKAGKAVAGRGANFLWAVESETPPQLFVDDKPEHAMHQIAGSKLWFYEGWMRPGWSHSFHYMIDGKRVGGLSDVASHHPEAYEQPGVPKGTLSEKMVHESKIYPGMKCDYWIYVPAQYNAASPAAVMIWQDGEGAVNRNGNTRTLNVVDNLIHQKRIPVMIQVLVSPGSVGERRLRSLQYDSVDDVYPRFLLDEILPLVAAKYKLRTDGYSRAIAGNSSGGICAFNAAWQRPDEFSRVLSRIGSFTSIQWPAVPLVLR